MPTALGLGFAGWAACTTVGFWDAGPPSIPVRIARATAKQHDILNPRQFPGIRVIDIPPKQISKATAIANGLRFLVNGEFTPKSNGGQ
ncbi:MAG: hypothetical protein ABSH09_05825 [Bryobacteraceae bacterium]|jgi:hypothetical protein